MLGTGHGFGLGPGLGLVLRLVLVLVLGLVQNCVKMWEEPGGSRAQFLSGSRYCFPTPSSIKIDMSTNEGCKNKVSNLLTTGNMWTHHSGNSTSLLDHPLPPLTGAWAWASLWAWPRLGLAWPQHWAWPGPGLGPGLGLVWSWPGLGLGAALVVGLCLGVALGLAPVCGGPGSGLGVGPGPPSPTPIDWSRPRPPARRINNCLIRQLSIATQSQSPSFCLSQREVNMRLGNGHSGGSGRHVPSPCLRSSLYVFFCFRKASKRRGGPNQWARA